MKGEKTKTVYVCNNCGNIQPKWSGRCPECGAWNTLIEERVEKHPVSSKATPRRTPIALSGVSAEPMVRIGTGEEEFDRVLGGGFVRGSVTLLAGEPGIGKSTLVLQALARLPGEQKLYFSGEESEEQIQLRAARLRLSDTRVKLLGENSLGEILAQIEDLHPAIVVVDSIQTIYSEEFDNVPGSVTQVRECAGQLLRKAKEMGLVLIFIGHITKEGLIAGPKVLEHLVDTVLYLEGNRLNFYRTLRAVKNRFGSTNEIGVFEMLDAGLVPVENPTLFFVTERREHVAGSAITVSLEGTRPLLIETQALVTQTVYGTPQRTANGIDYRRFMMLIAVAERRGGIPLRTQDVFINLAGGLRVDETAIDLSIVAAMASSFRDLPLESKAVFVGEVGLVGEVRSVPFLEARLREALKFGYEHFYIPRSGLAHLPTELKRFVTGIESIGELFNRIF